MSSAKLAEKMQVPLLFLTIHLHSTNYYELKEKNNGESTYFEMFPKERAQW
jgi:hypothetical protein